MKIYMVTGLNSHFCPLSNIALLASNLPIPNTSGSVSEDSTIDRRSSGSQSFHRFASQISLLLSPRFSTLKPYFGAPQKHSLRAVHYRQNPDTLPQRKGTEDVGPNSFLLEILFLLLRQRPSRTCSRKCTRTEEHQTWCCANGFVLLADFFVTDCGLWSQEINTNVFLSRSVDRCYLPAYPRGVSERCGYGCFQKGTN